MEKVVDELSRLIAFPTVSNRPVVELAAHLAQKAEDLGFRVERFDPGDRPGKCSVIASIGDPEAVDGLVISGHMDVVPTEGQPWTSDPFRLTPKGDRLYGRGTADMKGFIAATYEGLARIPRGGYRRPLVLIWTHDEEIGCLGSAELAKAWAGRTLPRACWIGEPTGFQIQRMHPGHVAIELVVEGRAAHSSRPDLGTNAIEAAAAIALVARGLADTLQTRKDAALPEMERPWVTLNVAEIHGGRAINIVPDQCTLRIGYRPLPGQDPNQVYEELMERVTALKLPTPVHGRILRITPSMLTPDGTPLQPVLDTHAHDHRCGAASFATDGGNLAKLGMQPLVFGPGSIDVAHQADEYVPAGDLIRAVDVVESVVRNRCL